MFVIPYKIKLCMCFLNKSAVCLQVLDLSGNQIGPVCFRAIMYAMCQNTTITVLNVGDNQTDTDSAVSTLFHSLYVLQ